MINIDATIRVVVNGVSNLEDLNKLTNLLINHKIFNFIIRELQKSEVSKKQTIYTVEFSSTDLDIITKIKELNI